MSRLSSDSIAFMKTQDTVISRSSKTSSAVEKAFRIDEAQEDEGGSNTYAIACGVFASLGGLFFGYDQGVTGGVLVMDSFLESFCVDYYGTYEQCTASSADLPGSWLTFTTLYNVIYYIGCIFGAFASNFVADALGRRWSIFMAGAFFCIGTTWVVVTPSGQHTVALLGRFVEGIGVGNSSFILPLFGAEMAPSKLRGLLSGFMQMTVVTGLLAAGIVNYIVENMDNGWRITNAVALLPPIIVMLGIFFVPESPRWLFQKKGKAAAEATLRKLRQTDNVHLELEAIGEQLEAEGYGKSSYADVFHPSTRRRVFIAMSLQVLQQATGINPMFTYGGLFFQDIVGSGIVSLLVLQVVNFVSTIPAMYWVDRFGRRSLLLVGAVGMVIGLLVAATTFTFGCSGDADNIDCSSMAGNTILVFASFFIFNFAISWGPVAWIYPAEIFPLKIRAKAVSLSTMMNWTMGTAMIGIPHLFPYLNINGVFYLFAVLCCCCFVFVYFFCPETKGLLLEDIELLFNGGHENQTPRRR